MMCGGMIGEVVIAAMGRGELRILIIYPSYGKGRGHDRVSPFVLTGRFGRQF